MTVCSKTLVFLLLMGEGTLGWAQDSCEAPKLIPDHPLA